MAGLTAWESYIQGLITQLLGREDTLTTLINQMTLGLTDLVAPAGEPSLLSQATSILSAIAINHAQLTSIDTQLTAIAANILAIPTGPQLAGHAVTLPAPPSGYGGLTGSATASAVWSYVLGNGEDTGSALDDLYGQAESLHGNSYVTLPGYPWISGYSLNNWQNYAEQNVAPPAILDSGTILPTDASILAWANRAHHGPLGWTNTGFKGTTVPMQLDGNRSDVKWIINMTPAQFLAFQAVPKVPVLAPIWPGIANVTLHTSVALAPGVSVAVPMHGCFIDITGVPTRANFYQFDTVKSYRNLGAATFFDDNGDNETAQTFGLESHQLTPRTMVKAAGVNVRTVGGVSGWITPWTINP